MNCKKRQRHLEHTQKAILMRSPHTLPTCKPAGGRRAGEQPGRRSLEGVGGVLGLWVNFCDSAFTRSLFSIACEPVDGRGLPYVPAFGRDEWEETICRK